jgi:hypothetical protein
VSGASTNTGAEELRSLCADIEAGGVAVAVVGVPAHARRIAGRTLTRWWREGDSGQLADRVDSA